MFSVFNSTAQMQHDKNTANIIPAKEHKTNETHNTQAGVTSSCTFQEHVLNFFKFTQLTFLQVDSHLHLVCASVCLQNHLQ